MRMRILFVCCAALAALIMTLPSLAANSSNATTCTGTLAPGTYKRVVVPDGASCVTFTGPVTIKGGVFVGAGATFVLGSEENPVHTGTISGGVRSQNAASVQIHFSTINGGVNLTGGAGPFGGPFEITWNTIEDSVINGSANITGYNGFWQGFFRNTVNGTVNFSNNTVIDPDGNEVQTNTIHGNLNCSGNTPAPHQGDSEGSPNNVTGQKTGQCTGVGV
jgi:hypothetical protein